MFEVRKRTGISLQLSNLRPKLLRTPPELPSTKGGAMGTEIRSVDSDDNPKAHVSLPGHLRTIAEFLVVGICTVAFVVSAIGDGTRLLTGSNAASRDFITYWASARQLIHHSNPYNAHDILQLERSAGFPPGVSVMVMRNPPFTLPLVLPLGFFDEKIAAGLWSLLLLGSLVASVRIVWIMHNRPDNYLHYLGYTFAAALSCLASGQISLFVLLGLVLFLRFNRTSPLIAGASLWFCAPKPHLFLPFGAVLLAWIIRSKRYRIAVGAVGAFLVSLTIAYALDPSAWLHYREMMSHAGIEKQPIPCVSIVLRQIIRPESAWLQYLPAFLGCVWALFYFYKHRNAWDWMEHGSLLMLVSVAVAPYAWFMDQVVLIPALLHALYQTRSRLAVAVLASISAIIEIANFRGVPLVSVPLYLWTAPAWLLWYLWASRPIMPLHDHDRLVISASQ